MLPFACPVHPSVEFFSFSRSARSRTMNSKKSFCSFFAQVFPFLRVSLKVKLKVAEYNVTSPHSFLHYALESWDGNF